MMTDHQRQLEANIAWFNEHRAELVSLYRGQWAAICEQKLMGTWPSFQKSYEKGVEIAGHGNILVRQVVETDEVIYLPAYEFGLLCGQIRWSS